MQHSLVITEIHFILQQGNIMKSQIYPFLPPLPTTWWQDYLKWIKILQ